MIPHKEIYDLAVLSLYTNGWCSAASPVAALRMLKHVVVYAIDSSNGCDYLIELTITWIAGALVCSCGSDAHGARVQACRETSERMLASPLVSSMTIVIDFLRFF